MLNKKLIKMMHTNHLPGKIKITETNSQLQFYHAFKINYDNYNLDNSRHVECKSN